MSWYRYYNMLRGKVELTFRTKQNKKQTNSAEDKKTVDHGSTPVVHDSEAETRRYVANAREMAFLLIRVAYLGEITFS